jgi:diguanylate cyclase (GGDEF)-like protein
VSSAPSRSALAEYEPALEDAYQADLAGEKVRVCRLTHALAVLLYSAFAVLDLWAAPSSLAAIWTIRIVVVSGTISMCTFATAQPARYARHYVPLTCATYLWWGLGVELIIVVCHPGELAWTAYYAGLLLVSMALYAWTYLLPWHAGAVGSVLMLSYFGVAAGVQHLARDGAWTVLLANCFFLGSANIIGLMSLQTRERFSRQAFLLKNALRRELRLEEEAKRQSEYLSQHDPLTGLANRLHFVHGLQQLLKARPPSDTVAVLFLDLDGFKSINDEHGHAAGDAVLCCVAERMQRVLRSNDLLARLGGDEFVAALALAQPYGRLAIDRLGNELRTAIAQPMEVDGRLLTVTVSIGAAVFPEGGRTADELLRSADRLMYDAKRRQAVRPFDKV